MPEGNGLISRFDGAVLLLPPGLREAVKTLGAAECEHAEEIRIRSGHPVSVVLPDREVTVSGEAVTRRGLDGLLDIATGASAYSARDSLKAGYITVRGGYRVGLCGTVIMRDGEVSGFRTLSSASIRIPREVIGAADSVAESLVLSGKFISTLIISPPGAGKTTLLRDLIRTISNGGERWGLSEGLRISLADERGEVAAVFDGNAQMDVGKRTDILDSCPKAEAMMMLLRSMNPQVIALDEITAPDDVTALESAANCGVSLLATAHADSLDDLKSRVIYKRLLDGGIFKKAVLISKRAGRRNYSIRDLEAQV